MSDVIKYYTNQKIRKDSLLKDFLKLGYLSCKFVGGEGDFAHRGGVVDIFPSGFEDPLRIELIDDNPFDLFFATSENFLRLISFTLIRSFLQK